MASCTDSSSWNGSHQSVSLWWGFGQKTILQTLFIFLTCHDIPSYSSHTNISKHLTCSGKVSWIKWDIRVYQSWNTCTIGTASISWCKMPRLRPGSARIPPKFAERNERFGCVQNWYLHIRLSILNFPYKKNWLVVYLPLWKIWKSMGRILPYMMENKKCLKPPTRKPFGGYSGMRHFQTHPFFFRVIYSAGYCNMSLWASHTHKGQGSSGLQRAVLDMSHPIEDFNK